MNPQLKPQTAWIEVAVKDEKPPCPWWYYVRIDGLPRIRSLWWDEKKNNWFHENDCREQVNQNVTHFLNPQPHSFILSKEELEDIVGKAWDAGRNDYEQDFNYCEKNTPRSPNHPDKEMYINNLFK